MEIQLIGDVLNYMGFLLLGFVRLYFDRIGYNIVLIHFLYIISNFLKSVENKSEHRV